MICVTFKDDSDNDGEDEEGDDDDDDKASHLKGSTERRTKSDPSPLTAARISQTSLMSRMNRARKRRRIITKKRTGEG